MLSFSDIFKSSFLSSTSSFNYVNMGIALALALCVGLFIMLIYRKTFSGVMYSKTFAVSLLALTLITTVIILAVTSNVVLSLGMVGALSIVRFRSAIKDPIDIAFLFWAICVGIVLGAGLIPLAVIGSILIGLVLFLLINKKSHDNPYVLIVNCASDETEKSVMEKIGQSVKSPVLKSKAVSASGGIELSIEIRLRDRTTGFLNELCALAGVSNAVLVSYNGDYMD